MSDPFLADSPRRAPRCRPGACSCSSHAAAADWARPSPPSTARPCRSVLDVDVEPRVRFIDSTRVIVPRSVTGSSASNSARRRDGRAGRCSRARNRRRRSDECSHGHNSLCTGQLLLRSIDVDSCCHQDTVAVPFVARVFENLVIGSSTDHRLADQICKRTREGLRIVDGGLVVNDVLVDHEELIFFPCCLFRCLSVSVLLRVFPPSACWPLLPSRTSGVVASLLTDRTLPEEADAVIV